MPQYYEENSYSDQNIEAVNHSQGQGPQQNHISAESESLTDSEDSPDYAPERNPISARND